jgi:hypothetical protein
VGSCRLILDPGVCGFKCEIEAREAGKRRVQILITSECNQISRLNEMLDILDLHEIFITPNKNRVFLLSEKAGCHASCPIPIGVLKCAEVALGVALPRGVAFHFDPCSHS